MSVPKLRFTKPDGTAFPDWQERTLGQIAKRCKEKNVDFAHTRVLTNSAIQGVIDQGDYFDKDIANADNLSGYYIVKEGDFVYNPRISVTAPVGPIKRNEIGVGVMSPLYTVFRFNESDTSFLNRYFQTNFWHDYMKSVANYGARHDRMAISSADFMDMPLPFPHPDEQAKIADALSAVDAKIAALRAKVTGLETYKRGLMQALFSQRLRFTKPDGTAFPDWEEKRLGEVFLRVTRKNNENNLNVLTISAQQGLVNQREFFNKSVSALDVTRYYLLKRGDFAYNKSYSNGYPMGAIKRLNLYDKGVVSTLYICFSTADETVARFFEHFFNFGGLNSEIEKIAQEGARNHGLLNMSVVDFFNDITIPFPHLDEQQKIAEALTAMDVKIQAVTAQVTHMESFKKGLLQQMFV